MDIHHPDITQYMIPAQMACNMLGLDQFSTVTYRGQFIEQWRLIAIRMHEHVVMTTAMRNFGIPA